MGDDQWLGRLDSKLDAIREDLQALKAGSATRYLGVFPKNFDYICNGVAGAKQLLVMCDWPGYGHFSKPDQFPTYQQSLVSLGRRARMICVARARRGELRERQFGNVEANWRRWLSDPEFVAKLQRLNGWRPGGDLNDFAKLLFQRQHVFDVSFASDIDYRLYDGVLPYYVWIVDGTLAFFSMYDEPQTDGRAVEHGFMTSDPTLVRTFEAGWKRIYAESSGA